MFSRLLAASLFVGPFMGQVSAQDGYWSVFLQEPVEERRQFLQQVGETDIGGLVLECAKSPEAQSVIAAAAAQILEHGHGRERFVDDLERFMRGLLGNPMGFYVRQAQISAVAEARLTATYLFVKQRLGCCGGSASTEDERP